MNRVVRLVICALLAATSTLATSTSADASPCAYIEQWDAPRWWDPATGPSWFVEAWGPDCNDNGWPDFGRTCRLWVPSSDGYEHPPPRSPIPGGWVFYGNYCMSAPK